MADAGNPNEEMKLVLVVNDEPGMTAGKIAAQCSHATLAVYHSSTEPQGGAAAVGERGAEEDRVEVPQRDGVATARHRGEGCEASALIVEDAGRTQVAAGSCTVIAIGPAPESAVNAVTGALRLL